MRAVRRRDTAPELIVRRLLHARSLRYRVDYPLPIPGVRRRADIAFPGLGLAVFVDGCWWHGCSSHKGSARRNAEWWGSKIAENVRRDRDTDERLRVIGWEVLRFWEHDDPASACDLIEATVGRLRGHRGRNGGSREATGESYPPSVSS
jgi:DNA mismatch endonuclease (patch repair protein)